MVIGLSPMRARSVRRSARMRSSSSTGKLGRVTTSATMPSARFHCELNVSVHRLTYSRLAENARSEPSVHLLGDLQAGAR